MNGQSADDHSGAIWVLGLALVIAVAATSPYWQTVALAVASGHVMGPAQAAGSGSAAGLGLTAGAFLLVVILAGVAHISEGMGAVALMLLIGLWVLFLLGHVKGVTGFFGLFGQGKG